MQILKTPKGVVVEISVLGNDVFLLGASGDDGERHKAEILSLRKYVISTQNKHDDILKLLSLKEKKFNALVNPSLTDIRRQLDWNHVRIELFLHQAWSLQVASDPNWKDALMMGRFHMEACVSVLTTATKHLSAEERFIYAYTAQVLERNISNATLLVQPMYHYPDSELKDNQFFTMQAHSLRYKSLCVLEQKVTNVKTIIMIDEAGTKLKRDFSRYFAVKKMENVSHTAELYPKCKIYLINPRTFLISKEVEHQKAMRLLHSQLLIDSEIPRIETLVRAKLADLHLPTDIHIDYQLLLKQILLAKLIAGQKNNWTEKEDLQCKSQLYLQTLLVLKCLLPNSMQPNGIIEYLAYFNELADFTRTISQTMRGTKLDLLAAKEMAHLRSDIQSIVNELTDFMFKNDLSSIWTISPQDILQKHLTSDFIQTMIKNNLNLVNDAYGELSNFFVIDSENSKMPHVLDLQLRVLMIKVDGNAQNELAEAKQLFTEAHEQSLRDPKTSVLANYEFRYFQAKLLHQEMTKSKTQDFAGCDKLFVDLLQHVNQSEHLLMQIETAKLSKNAHLMLKLYRFELLTFILMPTMKLNKENGFTVLEQIRQIHAELTQLPLDKLPLLENNLAETYGAAQLPNNNDLFDEHFFEASCVFVYFLERIISVEKAAEMSAKNVVVPKIDSKAVIIESFIAAKKQVKESLTEALNAKSMLPRFIAHATQHQNQKSLDSANALIASRTQLKSSLSKDEWQHLANIAEMTPYLQLVNQVSASLRELQNEARFKCDANSQDDMHSIPDEVKEEVSFVPVVPQAVKLNVIKAKRSRNRKKALAVMPVLESADETPNVDAPLFVAEESGNEFVSTEPLLLSVQEPISVVLQESLPTTEPVAAPQEPISLVAQESLPISEPVAAETPSVSTTIARQEPVVLQESEAPQIVSTAVINPISLVDQLEKIDLQPSTLTSIGRETDDSANSSISEASPNSSSSHSGSSSQYTSTANVLQQGLALLRNGHLSQSWPSLFGVINQFVILATDRLRTELQFVDQAYLWNSKLQAIPYFHQLLDKPLNKINAPELWNIFSVYADLLSYYYLTQVPQLYSDIEMSLSLKMIAWSHESVQSRLMPQLEVDHSPQVAMPWRK